MTKAKAAASRRKRAIGNAAAKPVPGGRSRPPKSFPGHPPSRSIALYYWPTPNGWKISIMLEECRLPYVLKPVNIGRGEQFAPEFLKISPNNRMPAIVDPDGPGGRPISVFESGAILQYLGRKTGKFYPADERARAKVEEWLFWQVGGLGPMAGQANHFLNYAGEDVAYAKRRYLDEVHRLFGVMETQFKGRKYLAGAYSIADIACWGWVVSSMRFQPLDEFPNLAAWQARVGARPAVKRGHALGTELRRAGAMSEGERKILFGQRAR